MEKCPAMIFLAKYELQSTVTYTVFLQFNWYLNSYFFLYYLMLYTDILN